VGLVPHVSDLINVLSCTLEEPHPSLVGFFFSVEISETLVCKNTKLNRMALYMIQVTLKLVYNNTSFNCTLSHATSRLGVAAVQRKILRITTNISKAKSNESHQLSTPSFFSSPFTALSSRWAGARHSIP
jgi:hypothetical protein